MNNKLQSLVEEAKKQKKYLDVNLDQVPTNLLTVHSDRKRFAPSRIEDLKKEYVSEMVKNVALVMVAGELSEDFSKKMSEDTGAETFNFNTLTVRVVNRLNSFYLSNRTSNNTLVPLLDAALREEFENTNIPSYGQFVYNESFQGYSSNREEIELLTKKLINNYIDLHTQLEYAVNTLAEKAFEEGFSQKIYPIVINYDIKNHGALKKVINQLNIKSVFVMASELADENGEDSQKNEIYISEIKQKKLTETYKKIKKLLN